MVFLNNLSTRCFWGVSNTQPAIALVKNLPHQDVGSRGGGHLVAYMEGIRFRLLTFHSDMLQYTRPLKTAQLPWSILT